MEMSSYKRRKLKVRNTVDKSCIMLVFLALGDAHFSAFYPTRNRKVAFYPTPTPDASQWNIGCLGSQRKMLALAMYISLFWCRFHLRLVPNENPISGGIWALVLELSILDSVKAIFHWKALSIKQNASEMCM